MVQLIIKPAEQANAFPDKLVKTELVKLLHLLHLQPAIAVVAVCVDTAEHHIIKTASARVSMVIIVIQNVCKDWE